MLGRCICLLLLNFAVFLSCQAQSAQPLALEKTLPLPGIQGRIDHLSFDSKGDRLFVSALGNGTVEVIDLRTMARSHEITGLKEPQGVLFSVQDDRLFVACGGDGTLRSYSGSTYAPLRTVSLGDDADNVRFDAASHEILVGYGSGGIAAFNKDLKQISDVKLPAHPESFQIGQSGSLLYINIPDGKMIAVVDRARNAVTHQWPQFTAHANFPMALDEASHRVFIGFRRPPLLEVLNADSGEPVAQLPIAADADDMFYDHNRRRIYVIGGEGVLDVIEQKDADHYVLTQQLQSSPGARTGLFVSDLNRLYVAAPQHGPKPAEILIYRVQ